MKTIFNIFLCIVCISCFNKSREKDQLNPKVIVLEQKMDSMNGGGKSNAAVPRSNRCQAITKRGKQCKRKAQHSSYCWQHVK